MAEYIEREALIESLRESYEKLERLRDTLQDEDSKQICKIQLIAFCEAILRVKDVPAADVVEIPCRCAECQFAIPCETDHPCYPVREYLYCNDRSDEVKPDGFCSYGERKEA